MKKHTREENDTAVKSRYFSIETFFKTPANANKRLKPSASDLQVENAIKELEETKEQCPLCRLWILTTSVSMEVHVNQCLDKEQEREKENIPPSQENDSSICGKDVQSCQQEKDSTPVADDSKPPPSLWKSMFSLAAGSTAALASVLGARDVNTNILPAKNPPAGGKRKYKPCPFYKRVRDTRFTVDAFSYGRIADCEGYFLTHFHADHYGGLRASWTHGPIYCSQVTANLVKQELRVDPRRVHPLPMNQLCPIPGSDVQVALIDANHCPGSVLFLFVLSNQKRHLHTGDFRAAPRMCLHPLIKQPENPPLNSLHLDTTYLSPQYAFPAQDECIQAVCDLVRMEVGVTPKTKKPSLLESWIHTETPQPVEQENPMTSKDDAFQRMMDPNNRRPAAASRVLIVVGTYTIGKERVFINIARMLKCKIYAPSKKRRILECQQDDELNNMLTGNPLEAQVHVVPLREIRADIMSNYLKQHRPQFTSLVAFKPSGWTYKSAPAQTSVMKMAPLFQVIAPPVDRAVRLQPYYKRDGVKLVGVPYSEHSSFRELASFVASLDVQHIIPTVNVGQLPAMSAFLDKWQEDKRAKRIQVVDYPNQEHW
ncbi:hypothetical protein [Parasitella parasitica]|uniref:Metallo-beta-lactamase domain-containing protein n=1 Tax=Parasitella parasitica TaxID=35722 RepID=A0A0B7N085_9FUNG|nr:hypothetical protein [Parasitella parasitica]